MTMCMRWRHILQVLFGYLQVSQKSWCDTLPFCLAFKDYDGSPIRVNEQKARAPLIAFFPTHSVAPSALLGGALMARCVFLVRLCCVFVAPLAVYRT